MTTAFAALATSTDSAVPPSSTLSSATAASATAARATRTALLQPTRSVIHRQCAGTTQTACLRRQWRQQHWHQQQLGRRASGWLAGRQQQLQHQQKERGRRASGMHAGRQAGMPRRHGSAAETRSWLETLALPDRHRCVSYTLTSRRLVCMKRFPPRANQSGRFVQAAASRVELNSGIQIQAIRLNG